jgi:hypothetical protein
MAAGGEDGRHRPQRIPDTHAGHYKQQRYLGSFRHARSTEVLGTSVLLLHCYNGIVDTYLFLLYNTVSLHFLFTLGLICLQCVRFHLHTEG